jgi:hypothetical protein
MPLKQLKKRKLDYSTKDSTVLKRMVLSTKLNFQRGVRITYELLENISFDLEYIIPTQPNEFMFHTPRSFGITKLVRRKSCFCNGCGGFSSNHHK